MKRFLKLIFLFVVSTLPYQQVWAGEDCTRVKDPQSKALCIREQEASYEYEDRVREVDDGSTLFGEMRRLQDAALDVIEKSNEQMDELVDDLEALDTDDNAACCEAIEDYESISCSGIRNRWARAACLIPKINAKNNVVSTCGPGVDPTGSRSEQGRYMARLVGCGMNDFMEGADAISEEIKSLADNLSKSTDDTVDRVIENLGE